MHACVYMWEGWRSMRKGACVRTHTAYAYATACIHSYAYRVGMHIHFAVLNKNFRVIKENFYSKVLLKTIKII